MRGKKRAHPESSEAPISVKSIRFMIPPGMTLEKISPLFGKNEENDVGKKPKKDPKKGMKKQDGLEKGKGVRTSKRHRETEFKEEYSENEKIELREVEDDMKATKLTKNKKLLLHKVVKEHEKEEECLERKSEEAGNVVEAEPDGRVPKLRGKRSARRVRRKLKRTAEEKHVEKKVEVQVDKDVVVGKEAVNLVQT